MSNKNICIPSNRLLPIIFIILIIVCGIFYIFYQNQYSIINNENKESQDLLKYKINEIEKKMSHSKEKIEKYNNQVINPPYGQNIPVVSDNRLNVLMNNNPQKLNAMDRVFNPLRYPYKSDYFYDQNWYPSLQLPSQVIGCGSRRGPCIGGTQVPIYNPSTPIDISDNNIAPVYISTRGPLGEPQQVGIMYKVYGDENDTLPLFGRKKYPNERTWNYYTLLGSYSSKVPVVTKNKHDELGTNDIVFIKGRKDAYRVTIYESDFPQYIPYL